jgi:Uma2 family endonuclease
MALLERLTVEEVQPFPSVADIPPGTRYVPEKPLTVDEFYELIDDDSPAELDEGAIVMPSPAGLHHEDCFGFLFSLLRLYAESRGLGTVLGSRSKARLGVRTAREPDISFVSAGRADELLKPLEIAGGPDLVVEIIASNKGRSEAIAKVPQYQQASVGELWLIDLRLRRVTQLLLENVAFRETVLTETDTLQAAMIPGFRLSASLLFSPPGKYPPALPILQALLSMPLSEPRDEA